MAMLGPISASSSGVEFFLVDRDLLEGIHDRDGDTELVAKDGVEVQHARPTAREHDLIDPIGSRGGGEEIKRLPQLPGEIFAHRVEDGDDLLDAVVARLVTLLQLLGLLEREAELALDGVGVLVCRRRLMSRQKSETAPERTLTFVTEAPTFTSASTCRSRWSSSSRRRSGERRRRRRPERAPCRPG